MCVLYVNAFVIKEQMLKKMKKVDFSNNSSWDIRKEFIL